VNTLSNAVNVSGIAQSTNIQFKKVALQLEVVPLINSAREVSLDILQKVDSLGLPVEVDGNLIPTINTRYIRTNVTAPNNCTIVLGGLSIDDKGKQQSGIPVLSKIPLIGGLFRTTNNTKRRTELIVMMRPEVTMTKLEEHLLKQKATEKTHFGPELDDTDCPDCPVDEQGNYKQIVEPDLPPMTLEE
jgi:general secretion pathway protein D